MLWQSRPAACAPAQAAEPFPVIPVEAPATASHRAAWLCVGSGVALTVASFVIADRADRTYEQYLDETDPARIEELYDHTVWLDGWSRGTLLGGQALIASGLYLRFLRHPSERSAGVLVGPGRCALAVRF